MNVIKTIAQLFFKNPFRDSLPNKISLKKIILLY